ncbi:MAG TPA: NAD-dependent epimerase/dehydratase family protein [Thermoanaerobaculia bacterium]|nr:NAD-dependent epimerase/dehydratase family protein [Thermoanaerobaculia bacterium]
MRVFLTGATGYIGGAVAAALRSAGHEVGALVRADADSKRLRDLGAFLITGDLESLPSLREQLAGYDAFVHTAQSRQNTVDADRKAVDTFTSLGGFFLYTSGVWVLGNTTSADEASDVSPLALVAWRPPHEELALGSGGAVLRPGCVYGDKQSLLADWFAASTQNRALQIVGDGSNHWAMVDLHDLADLYVRAIEQRATGVLHGIDDTRATLDECARAVAPKGTMEHTPLDAARQNFGPFADALAVDQQIDSKATREKTGWSPRRTFTNSVEEQWLEWRRSQSATD